MFVISVCPDNTYNQNISSAIRVAIPYLGQNFQENAMHELSIAYSLVEIASQAAANAQVTRVDALHLRLGALSGVVKEALLFSYEIAVVGTVLEGSRLEIEEIPVALHCPACAVTSTLDTLQSFRCPLCGQASNDIRQGRELEVVSLEIADEQPTYS
jgi:hydrogenase nickel incorporation protein HypA/HybF